jgi:heme exporter protein C
MTPAQLKRSFGYIQPISLWIFLISTPIALLDALCISPPDYLHGNLVRILYIHVLAAWLAVGIYVVMGICSFASIVLRSSFYSLCAQSLALPGCILTVICMATGAIWGKPAWGTWWVWDARLTSVVVLFFLYVGYINFCDGALNKAASILNVVGLINIPIIKWSVDWWFTLHQPSSFSLTQKPAIATEMLIPLLLMTVTFSCWALTLFTRRFSLNLERFQREHHGIA